MKHSLVRFSTRSLLLLVTVFCVWLGLHVKATKAQKEAVQAVRDFGGWVRYDYQVPDDAAEDLAFAVAPSGESRVPKWLLEQLGVDFFHDVAAVSFHRSFEEPRSWSHNSNGSSKGLAILDSFPKLRVVLVNGSQANDSNLSFLSGLRNLRRLDLTTALVLSDTGIEHLAELSNLRTLRIDNASLSDKALAVLGRLKNLKQLILSSSDRFTDAGVEYLVHLPLLERLSLATETFTANNISDNGLNTIGRLINLKVLYIRGRKFTDKGFEHLSGLKCLEQLVLSSTERNEIGDEGLSVLSGLHELEYVNMQASDVTDKGLRHLYGLKKLACVILGSTKVTTAGVAKLQAVLPRLEFFIPPTMNENGLASGG